MYNEPKTSVKTIVPALAVVLMTSVFWLALILPSLAQTPEPLDVQEKVDKFLGALVMPTPAAVHLLAPDVGRPHIAGQPYEQQPAALRSDTAAAGGDGGRVVIFGVSDARLKREVRQLATLENGLKVYAFKYLWDDTVRVGVMAQDLLAHDSFKAAVVLMPNSYYGVDYAMLGLRMITLEEWRDSPRAVFATGRASPVSAQRH